MKIFSNDKRINLRKQFIEALKYVRESRNYIYFSLGLFVLFGIFGFVFADKLRALDEVLRSIVNRTEGLNGFELTAFILQNNIMTSFFAFLGGALVGIPSFIVLMTNGILIGYVMERVVQVESFLSLWKILPHGIFELPAIFISIGMGIRLGLFMFARNRKKEFLDRFYGGMNAFLFIVIPLLVIAAIIEGLLIVILG